MTSNEIRNFLTAISVVFSFIALAVTLYDRYAAGKPLLNLRFKTEAWGELKAWLVVKNVGLYDIVVGKCSISPTGFLALSKSNEISDMIDGQRSELGDITIPPGDEREFWIIERYEAGHLALMGKKKMRFRVSWCRTRSMGLWQVPLRMKVPAKALDKILRRPVV